MIENLKYAARNRQSAMIGGEFSPRELAEAAHKLETYDELLEALQTILNISLMDHGHWAKTIEAEAARAIAKAEGRS